MRPARLTGALALARDALREAPQAGLALTATVTASAAYAPLFDGAGWALPVALAAVLGTATGVLTRALRWPDGAATLLAVVVLALAAPHLLRPGEADLLPTPGAVLAGLDELAQGLARLLTVVPPVEARGEMVALPVLLAAVSGFTTVRLAGHSPVLLPLLPPVAVFLGGLLLTPYHASPRWAVTAALLTVSLATALARSNPSPAAPGALVAGAADAGDRVPRSAWLVRTRPGRLAVALPVVAAVSALAVLGAALLPVATGADRVDARRLHDAPLDLEHRLNPLAEVRRQLLEPTSHVFTARLDADGAAVDRIRVAALDDFDGAVWSSTSRFTRVGTRLPRPRPLRDPATVRLDIEVAGHQPPYLPQAGQPIEAAGEELAFDAASGMLVTSRRPFHGYRYSLTAEAARSGSPPGSARPAAGPDVAALLRLPVLPDTAEALDDRLRVLALQVTADTGEPYDRLAALAAHLQTLPVDPEAPPGSSYGALARVLPDAPEAQRRVTDEQTAAAFAVMARMLGSPARVATGYRLDRADLVDGAYVVRAGRATAWAEVLFDDLGWVPFDTTGARQAPPLAGDAGARAGASEPPRDVAARTDPEAVSPGRGPAAGGDVVGRLVGGLSLLLVLALGTALAVVAGKRARRAWRSRRGPADVRIGRAWREVTDLLGEHGLPVESALTPEEVALLARARFGQSTSTRVERLAPLVTAALCAPGPPDAATARRAWDLEADLRAHLVAGASPQRRLLAVLDPRPLLPAQRGERRERRGRRPVGGPRGRRP